jgi:hypothetical protein
MMDSAQVPSDKSVKSPSLYATQSWGMFDAKTLIGKMMPSPLFPINSPDRSKTRNQNGATLNSLALRPNRRAKKVMIANMRPEEPVAKLTYI